MKTKESYIELTLREFERLKSLGDGAINQVSAESFFAIPAPGDNSIAVIVKHIGGNLVSRWTDFLISDGEKPGRDRDREFQVLAEDTRDHLLAVWEKGWSTLFSALEPLSEADLDRTITIRGESLTVMQAINRQLTHYAYHVGQIVYVAKHFAGETWRSLSIPRGASTQFNKNPVKYVGKS